MKTCLFFVSVLLACTSSGAGQEVDQNCVPIGLPAQCQQIADSLAAREASYEERINALQELLKGASTSAKTDLLRRIRAIEQQRARDTEIPRLTRDLASCRQHFDTTPRRQLAPSTLSAVFRGTATVTTTRSEARGPFTQNLNLGILFSRDRCTLSITSFTPISFQTNVPLAGQITITVTQTGGGTGQFFPISGQIVMPLTLFFNYGTILAGNDTATLTLTTGNSISARGTFNLTGVALPTAGGTTVQGPVTLVGTTVFQNGFLGGQEGGFTVAGNIAIPQAPPPQGHQECLRQCDENFRNCMDSIVAGRPTPAQCAAGRNQCRARCPH
jgi:hypothetical protein